MTGRIPGWANGTRARELHAVLGLGRAGGAEEAPPVIGLVWKRGKAQRAVPLTPGTTETVPGTAYPLRGARPAVAIRFMRQRLVLSFDTEQARTRPWTSSRRRRSA